MNRRTAAALIGLWLIPGALYSLETVYMMRAEGRDVLLWRVLLFQLPSWQVWALATPPVVWLARRVPLGRRSWPRAVAVHAGACVVIALCYAVVKSSLLRGVFPELVRGAFVDRLIMVMAEWLPASVLAYAAVVGVATAIANARTARDRALRAAELSAELSRAQLDALRAQIHPHFVFNALHTVAAIVRAREPDRAVEVLVQLADLLRDTFRGDPACQVPLREELAWIARYLAIQTARFEGRVEVVWQIDDRTLDALVPQMVIQPLVENAFHHGVARLGGPGRVELFAGRDDQTLTLRVRDNGPALEASAVARSPAHTGIASTRARLHLLYAERAQLTLVRDPDACTAATVTLPFQPALPEAR